MIIKSLKAQGAAMIFIDTIAQLLNLNRDKKDQAGRKHLPACINHVKQLPLTKEVS